MTLEKAREAPGFFMRLNKTRFPRLQGRGRGSPKNRPRLGPLACQSARLYRM